MCWIGVDDANAGLPAGKCAIAAGVPAPLHADKTPAIVVQTNAAVAHRILGTTYTISQPKRGRPYGRRSYFGTVHAVFRPRTSRRSLGRRRVLSAL